MESNTKQKKSENKSAIFTKETLGVVTVLFATLILVCLITGDKVFSAPGLAVSSFMFGTFGYFAYAVNIYAFILGVEFITGKKVPLKSKTFILATIVFVLSALLAHVISMAGKVDNYGDYLALSYTLGAGGITSCSGGGIITALYAYPVMELLTVTGASVVIGLTIAGVSAYLIYDFVKIKKERERSAPKFRSSAVTETQTVNDMQIVGEKEYPVENVTFDAVKPNQKLFVNNEKDFAFKTKKEIAKNETEIKIDFSTSGLGVSRAQGVYTEAYADEMNKNIEYIKTPAKFDYDSSIKNSYYGTSISEPIEPSRTSEETNTAKSILSNPSVEIPMYEHESKVSEAEVKAEDFSERYASTSVPEVNVVEKSEEIYRPYEEETTEEPNETDISEAMEILDMLEERGRRNVTPETDVIPEIPEIEEEPFTAREEPTPTNLPLTNRRRNIFFEEEVEDKKEEEREEPLTSRSAFTSRAGIDGNTPFPSRRFTPSESVKEEKEEKVEKPPVPINRVYNKPPLDLLEKREKPIDAPSEDHEGRMAIIKRTLEEFHINAEPSDFIQGPSITRYEIKMPSGVSVKRVLNYDNDLKMRLASNYGVRIEAPIPGKDAVGIEVANKTKESVGLRELLEETASIKLNVKFAGGSKTTNMSRTMLIDCVIFEPTKE